jgi:transposase
MLVEVYGDAAVTRKTVYKWSEWFRSGSESIDDEERPGRPSTSCTDENMIFRTLSRSGWNVVTSVWQAKETTLKEINWYFNFG